MFFRKQIYISQSLEDFNKARELLIKNNIPITTKVSDRANPLSPLWSIFSNSKRNRSGMMFENKKVQIFYYIFVKKDNFDLATQIINSR